VNDVIHIPRDKARMIEKALLFKSNHLQASVNFEEDERIANRYKKELEELNKLIGQFSTLI